MAIVVPPGALESHITEPWSFRTGIRLGEHLVQQLKLCVLQSPLWWWKMGNGASWFPTSPPPKLAPILQTHPLCRICLMKGFCRICIFIFQAIDEFNPLILQKQK